MVPERTGIPVRRFPDDLGVYGLPGDVAPWDIRFDPRDVAHLEPLGGGRFRVRVSTEPGLLDGMVVVRAEAEVTGHPLDRIGGTRFDHWSTEMGPFTEPAGFSLAFRSPDGHPVYRVPTGVTAAVERLDRWELDPSSPALDVPAWVQGAVIYQIFPDRFANGDPSNDPAGVVPWGTEPHSRQFHGGDLQGVVDHLDHLTGLGVEVLYLNPVFASPSNHRYDTTDYYAVDPVLGGNAALAALVEQAHSRAIRVVLDASFNHVHPTFFAFADLLRHGRSSPYRDWFVVHDWPLRIRIRPESSLASDRIREWVPVWEEQVGVPVEPVPGDGRPVDPTYEAWFGVPTMPRVNLAHPEARHYMLEVAAHWVRDYDVDGWRMDVARYVDPDFWNDFRRVVKAVKPDAYLLSEVMGDAGEWLQGDRFDATMNYSFRSLALGFIARDEIDGRRFLDDAARLLMRYAWPVTLANQNLVGSHDTPRFLDEAGGELWRLRLATILQMTFPGAPGIYYGDEVALEGGHDPGCRAAFPWDRVDHRLVGMISELSALRRRYPALRLGGWSPLGATRSVVAFERSLGGRSIGVVLNRSRRPATVELGRAARTGLWGEGTVEDGAVRVPGRDALIVRL